jgi:hypothetical protein
MKIAVRSSVSRSPSAPFQCLREKCEVGWTKNTAAATGWGCGGAPGGAQCAGSPLEPGRAIHIAGSP